MSRIAFIGDRDSVWGFRALGMTALPVVGADDAGDLLGKQLAELAAHVVLEHARVDLLLNGQ